MAKFNFIDHHTHTDDPFAENNEVSSEFETLLQQEKIAPAAQKLRVGSRVEGTVMSVGQEFVFIDLGGKNAGSIACEEFHASGLPLPKVGEVLHTYVKVDNGSEILLTRSLKRSDADLNLIREAYESRIPLEGKVEKVNKGGFEVMIGTHRAFVPMSNMELTRITDPDSYIGLVLTFHVAELRGKNIVLSRKELLKEEFEKRKSEILANLKEGSVVKGKITRLVPFGAFANVEGVDGLISLSELSHKRIKQASDVVQEGQLVSVRILKIEQQPRLKIALSLKDGSDRENWSEYQDVESKKTIGVNNSATNSLSVLADAFQKAKKRS